VDNISTYAFTYLLDDSDEAERQVEIDTIRKMRKGESFEFFKSKFVLEENLKSSDGELMVTDEELKKIYIDYNYMDSIIKKLVSYCPDLIKVYTRDDKKRELIKNALSEVDWLLLLNEIYDGLEESGDMFLEIFFNDEEDKIPKLRVLDSLNMKRALLDDKNRYKQYVYKEWVENEYASIDSGKVVDNGERERIVIYEKGRKAILDPLFNKERELKKDEKNNQEYEIGIIENRDSYINNFPIIHIKGYKKQRDEFSEIPASHYIDPSLLLVSILSNIRQTNLNLGFPILAIIDGTLCAGSRRTPAGFLGIKTNIDSKDGKQAQLQDVQIKNDLNSMFKEFTVARDDLFNKSGLITPTLLEKLNIDSSRVMMQLNLPSENKIGLYVDNIIKAMQLWFKILLKENGMYDEETDKNLSFMKPKFIIKSSPFEELLYDQSEVKSTKKSRKEIYIENGDSDEEIELREKEINEELGDENKDKSFAKKEVSDRVANGQNVDNNMINK